VVTDGPAPLRLWHRSGTATFPLESVRITDTVGAGDALTGALAAWIDRAQGTRSQLAHLVTEALPIAITVAQLTCQRRGADPPSAREVRNW
jgi:fructokinase